MNLKVYENVKGIYFLLCNFNMQFFFSSRINRGDSTLPCPQSSSAIFLSYLAHLPSFDFHPQHPIVRHTDFSFRTHHAFLRSPDLPITHWSVFGCFWGSSDLPIQDDQHSTHCSVFGCFWGSSDLPIQDTQHSTHCSVFGCFWGSSDLPIQETQHSTHCSVFGCFWGSSDLPFQDTQHSTHCSVIGCRCLGCSGKFRPSHF